jgi:hypothetical protein
MLKPTGHFDVKARSLHLGESSLKTSTRLPQFVFHDAGGMEDRATLAVTSLVTSDGILIVEVLAFLDGRARPVFWVHRPISRPRHCSKLP